MVSNKVELKTAKFEELDYRRRLLADMETMYYNIGYGENYGIGCMFQYTLHEKDVSLSAKLNCSQEQLVDMVKE